MLREEYCLSYCFSDDGIAKCFAIFKMTQFSVTGKFHREYLMREKMSFSFLERGRLGITMHSVGFLHSPGLLRTNDVRVIL